MRRGSECGTCNSGGNGPFATKLGGPYDNALEKMCTEFRANPMRTARSARL